MAKFLIYESMKDKPDLVRTKKELELYVLDLKIHFSYYQMIEKVEEVFENREKQAE